MEETKEPGFNKLDYFFKLSVILALAIIALVLAKDIFVPLVFAAVISIALLPLVKWLSRWIGNIPAILVVIFGTLLFVSGLTYLLANQMVQLIADLPNLEERSTVLLHQVSSTLTTHFSISQQDQYQFIRETVTGLTSFFTGLLLSTTNVVATLVQIPIYVLLFLIYRNRFKEFFIHAFPNSSEKLRTETDKVIRGYFTGQLLVILLITTLDSTGLLIIGINYAFFFGLLSGLLTVIPYIGNWIGGSLPVLMALVTKDSGWYAIAVICLYAVVHFIEGNIVSPRIMGHNVSVNALAAIVGLLLGGKILGIAGMIMAVPAIGMLRIMLSFSPHLSPLVVLLEDKPIKK